MAVTEGASWVSCRKVVVLRPMGNIRPPSVHHHPLAPADLPPVADPRHHRRPELRRPGLELVEHREPEQLLAVEIEQPLGGRD